MAVLVAAGALGVRPAPARATTATTTVLSLSSSSAATAPDVAHSLFLDVVELTASVTSGSPDLPTGPVTFLDGETVLGAANLSSGVARIRLPRAAQPGQPELATLSVGTHPFSARYNGDGDFPPSASETEVGTVDRRPGQLQLYTPELGTWLGDPVTFEAFPGYVLPLGSMPRVGPTGEVTLRDNGVAAGTAPMSNNVVITLAGLALGHHLVTAEYGGDTNFAPITSPTTDLLVRRPGPWGPPIPTAETPGPAAPAAIPPGPTAPPGSGYWMLGAAGRVYSFGGAGYFADARPLLPPGRSAVDVEPTPSAQGYWVVDDRGDVFPFGDASYRGGTPSLGGGEAVTSMSATPGGAGYWLFTNTGRVLAYGDAPFLGDMAGHALNGPVLGSVRTPSGRGYYMVASDGGIFSFGDAAFHGSMGGQRLNGPVVGLAPDPDGSGYWLVASDGGIFSFAAPFKGSMGGRPLNRPVAGMVAYGDGYLMVASDGGIFDFSAKPFLGSLGSNPPASPVVAVAVLDG